MHVSVGSRGVGRAQHLLQIYQIPTNPRGSRRYGASAGARKHAAADASGAAPRGGSLPQEPRKDNVARILESWNLENLGILTFLDPVLCSCEAGMAEIAKTRCGKAIRRSVSAEALSA